MGYGFALLGFRFEAKVSGFRVHGSASGAQSLALLTFC